MYNAPSPNIHRMVKPPCHGCTDRRVGCHGECQRYKEYKEKMSDEYRAAMEANAEQRRASKYEEERNKNRKYRRGK